MCDIGCRPQSRSGPVLSGTGSVVTTGVGAGGNREVGLWDRLPTRSSSP